METSFEFQTTSPILWIIYVALMLFYIIAMWKLFVKAGQPGWACLIPIYNLYVFLLVIQKPIWWIIMFFIPMINLIFMILASLALAEKFGKGAGFGVGLALLGFIFYPVLAFGNAQYKG